MLNDLRTTFQDLDCVTSSYKSEMCTLLDESETKRIVVILYKNTIVMYLDSYTTNITVTDMLLSLAQFM